MVTNLREIPLWDLIRKLRRRIADPENEAEVAKTTGECGYRWATDAPDDDQQA
jgi:hypothetical protein